MADRRSHRRDPGSMTLRGSMPRHCLKAAPLSAVVLAAALAASGARAQDYVRPDCRPLISEAAPSPDTSVSARWYRRFWTGDCGGLAGCFGGAPNWNGVVGDLVARCDAAARPQVLAKACRLGPLIGLEWTRSKDVRRIDTGDLRRFRSALASSHDVLAGLGAVEAQARAKIAAQR
jgi:hypothetical protein